MDTVLKLLKYTVAASALTTMAAAADKVEQPELFDFEHVSCRGGENEIRIAVTGVKNSVGLISADLYPNDKEGFLKKHARLERRRFAARAPVTTFCLPAPEAGKFAVTIYHDRNANQDFDKNGFGIPTEPWGVSMNPKVRLRAPHVDEAIFDVSETGADVEIKLN